MGGSSSESFGPQRIARCVDVFQKLASHWAEVKRLECRVTADESPQGKTLEQLAKIRFSVGVGEDLTELPFMDLLTVFKMFADHCLKEQSGLGRRPQHEYTHRYTMKTTFTEPQAMAILHDIITGVGIEVRQARGDDAQPAAD